MSGAPTARHVVLLPTYNERQNLPIIVPAILAAAPVEILILDDDSPDGTGELADRLAADSPRVRVLHRPRKAGLGAAYVAGFRQALADGYAAVIQMDADLSHPTAVLPRLMELGATYDIVLGSRWVEGGGTRNWPLTRRLLSRAGSLYARAWLGLAIRDLTGGFKCIRREVLAALDLDAITTTGYAFQIEVTYRAIRAGFTVTETPITFVEREDGVSKMSRRIIAEAILRVPLLRVRVP